MPIAPSEKPAGAPGAPYKPSAGNDVTVLTDATGAHALILGGDDTGGPKLESIDGTQTLVVGNGGTVIGGAATVSGQLGAAAANAAGSVPILDQLTSYLVISSGALPNTGAWASGTAKQNPTHGGVPRQVTVNVVVVMDGTANAASCTIAISPDDSTYTTVGAPGVSAAINTVGAETLLAAVSLPAEWFIKLTLVHCTVAASIYY